MRTVVWCTGFRPDFRWIQLPVFGPEGYPDHRRGIVAAAPGLGFVGLRYRYRIGSSLIGGVREDAEYSRPTPGLAVTLADRGGSHGGAFWLRRL